MDRRASLRVPVRINLKCSISNHEFSGTVTNLSENGMFIRTEETSCTEYRQFNVAVPLKGKTLRLSVKPVRSVNINGRCGMGVKVTEPSDIYLDYIEDLQQILYI